MMIMSTKKRIVIFLAIVVAASAFATPILFWDLLDRTQEGQMTMYNPTAEDGDTGIPVWGQGDLDNDGKKDAFLSAITGDGRTNNKSSCGELHVLFGVDTIRGIVDFADYDGVHENLLTIWGRNRKDYFSSNAKSADLDEDGFEDLIVSAMWADTLGRTDCGSLYIIWGGPHLRGRFIDLADTGDMAEFQITTITGPEDDDKFGVWISTGDADNDGHQDMLVGAPRADGIDDTHDQTGETYILFGPFARLDHIDLAATAHRRTIIYGVDTDDQMGNTVELEDINGDVYEDVLIGAGAYRVARLGDTDVDYQFEVGGAGDGPLNDRPQAGELYILPGRAIWPDTIDLAAGMPVGSTIIYGAYGNTGPEVGGDEFGEEISLGDVNNDGINDLMVGAFRADGYYNNVFWAGNSYLFYGRYNWPASVDLRNGLPDSTTCIWGGGVDWIIGDSSPLGDFNGDGFFDIFCAATHDAGPYGIFKAGTVRVVYGRASLLPQLIDLGNPPPGISIPVVQATEESDLLAYWCTSGDFDGDGYWELIPNVMHGDGPNNERRNAGDFHIISGEWFTNHPGQPRFLTALPLINRVELEWFDNAEAGADYHVIYRRLDSVSVFDSIGIAPYPQHVYLDSLVTSPNDYVYRIKAVSAGGLPSNVSNEAHAGLGASVGTGLPLVINGIHWDFYGNEARNFWANDVLMGSDAFDFWDLYFTSNYPTGYDPIGFGTDSLAEAIFNARRVIWVLNGFDPDTVYNDGNVLLAFDNVLQAYVQNGGELLVIGKEFNLYLPEGIERTMGHIVAWGFNNSVTGTEELTPLYPGLNNIGKRTGGANADNLPPASLDNSGCGLPIYQYASVAGEIMGHLSRPAPPNYYSLCFISHRPYRADESELRASMDFIFDNLLGYYPGPTGLATSPNGAQIVLNWDTPESNFATGVRVFRRRLGTSTVDTLGITNLPSTTFIDSTHNRFYTYDYWLKSIHSDGRTSLASDTIEGFAPGVPDNGNMLIINGMDWSVYNTELQPFYTGNVIQGTRPFRFWDLFTTANYPAGYTPVGHGTDSLMAAMWGSRTTVWLFNNFNGDATAFTAMLPVLNLYVESGGNLAVIGKELNLFLGTELTNKLQLSAWTPAVTWLNTDTARAEHPSLVDWGKINAAQMSSSPEFTIGSSPLVKPLFRRNLTAGSLIGAMSKPDAASPYNLVVISTRPYRALATQFRATMETILSDFLGYNLNTPVSGLTMQRATGFCTLRWFPVPGATGYRICKFSDLSLPHNPASVVATSATNIWTDPLPIPAGTFRSYFVVYPTFP